MSMLTKLQNDRVGLIELILMGFNVYLKNLKSILLAFCTIYLPFLIVMSALAAHIQRNPTNASGLFLVFFYVFVLFTVIPGCIYLIAVAVITENYVKGITTNYQRVVNKVFSSLVTLLLLSLRFSIMYILRCLLLLIPVIFFVTLISRSGIINLNLIDQYYGIAFAFGTILSFLLAIPVVIYLINNQYYGLAFILRDKRGTDAFLYSQSLVKGNWWRVFLFAILGILGGIINVVLQLLSSKLLSLLIADFWADLLSQVLPQFIAIGIGVAGILLFLNLDFQKSLDS